MAKLELLPEQSIIDGFKGTIDFYVWKGIPCARKWPRSPGHNRAPAVQEQWPTFIYVSKLWNELSVEVKDAYNWMAQGTRLTGRDYFTKGYYNTLYVWNP